MAAPIDPHTEQRRRPGVIANEGANAWGIAALLVILAFLAWFGYGQLSPNVDNTNASITDRATVPVPTSPPTPVPRATTSTPATNVP
jgi:hypothetical protein